MAEQFVLPDGDEINITTLVPNIAQYATLITKSAWNKLGKSILVQEIAFQRREERRLRRFYNQILKKNIINMLMEHYRQNRDLTVFQSDVANVIGNRSMRKPHIDPTILTTQQY